MANYWLLKSDPEEYGFDDLIKDGSAVWDGVTNNLALQNLRQMKKGDVILIYHTGAEKALVGLATATSNPYPDPKANNEKLVVIDLKPNKRVNRPVTLSAIKALPEFADFALVKLPRLSVMPVNPKQYQRLAELAGL
ncbi:MAG: EVE domain-containing protein [Acidobacteria bacterium]|nr:EVE domain-containing protein [Acidobacteriota bacterium]